MIDKSLFLASEVRELEILLASTPADNFIERMSLEARLASVKEALAALPQQAAHKTADVSGQGETG